jgi:phospholipase C
MRLLLQTGTIAVVLTLGCGSSSSDVTNPVDSATTSDTAIADDAGGETIDSGKPPIAPLPTPPDPPVTCPIVLPPDPAADKRAACTFGLGARADETLGVPKELAGKFPIRHVIVMMRENRAFDHLLGKLHDARPEVEAVPSTFQNLDKAGAVVAPFHADTTCIHNDPIHQWNAMHAAVNGGKMDGFVTSAADTTGTDGHFVMSYYEATDLPFTYWLASTWPVNDHHFASVRSGTAPDRLFMLLATNDGVRQSGLDNADPQTRSEFDGINAGGISWGVYTDGSPLEGALNWDKTHPGVGKVSDLIAALDAGTLPNVAFVDAAENTEDDHPTADLQRGEKWVKTIYDHAVASPQWERLAILWTYDEGGAFADHVPPPNEACIARPDNPKDAPYFELGVRVPFAVISPWARKDYVSHVVQEHTAITRFIETIFGLPAMTARDANSPALLDLFDFSSCTPPMLHPPPAPAPGTGGCK